MSTAAASLHLIAPSPTAPMHTTASTTPSFAQTAEGRLAYEDRGDPRAPVVLCLPGLGDTRAEYRALVPGLLSSGARVLTADLRGHGESDATFGSHEIVDHAADIGAVLDAAGVARVTLAANSMSAASALVFAQRHPERVEGILLLGPVARDLPIGAWLRPLFYLLLAGPWAALMWSLYYRSLFKRTQPADLADHVAMLRRLFGSPDRRRALLGSALARKTASAEAIAHVKVPMAIVMGTADPDFPNATAEGEWLRDHLGGGGHATLTLVQGVGHYPHLEDPGVALEAYRALRARIER